jgi:hypothetical protein
MNIVLHRFIACSFVALTLLPAAPCSADAQQGDNYTVEMVVLERPPFSYYAAPGAVRGGARGVGLELLEQHGNAIDDTPGWFHKHGLELGSSLLVPPEVAGAINGHDLIMAIPAEEYLTLIYADQQGRGRYLFLWSMASRRYSHGFDFGAYMLAPGGAADDDSVTQAIDWAMVEGGTLYVAHSHRNFAIASGGKNGYISAIDLHSRRLLWRSAALVSNAANFVIIGNTVISGYGFSAEPDYLYLLDAASGEQLQRIRLRSHPQYIVSKADRLYVRSYDSDYLFRVVQPSGDQRPPRLQPPSTLRQPAADSPAD